HRTNERRDRARPTARRADDRCRHGIDPVRAQARAAPAPQSAPQVSVLRPSDRRPRLQALHRKHALSFGIPAWALAEIAAAVFAIDGVFTPELCSIPLSPKSSPGERPG